MKPAIRILATLALAALVLGGAGTAEASRRRKPSRKSPHAEITAIARVETAPQKKVHSNRRRFEEFDVTIVSSQPVDQDRASDGRVVVARNRAIHIVHDLTCGGTSVDLAPGDRVEIKGEYVAPSNGGDLIHFTHPAGRECGNGAPHADGYLRKAS